MSIKLLPQQQQFVRDVSRGTGLNSRVVAAWVVAEMGGASSGPARSRAAAKNNNWLNIGYFDSGPGAITKDKAFGTPQSAAKATIQFLKGEKFGASSGIRKILNTVGGSQEQQIHAIATSGWASSGYNGGNNLRQLLGQVPAPGKSAAAGHTVKSAGTPGAAAVPVAADQTTLTPAPLPEAADASALAAALAPRQAPGSAGGGMPLAAPGASAGPTFSKTALQVQGGGGAAPRAASGVDVLLASLAATPQGEVPVAPTVTMAAAPAATSSSSGPAAPAAAPKGPGKVVVTPGADRPGHGLQKPILGLLRKVSQVSGREVKVTTGTNHSYLTTSGNVSDHVGGNAADLGLAGDIRYLKGAERGRVAKQGDLIAAHAIQVVTGMKFDKALSVARQGGIHNFQTKQGKVQIIWRTTDGGNHFNHVHVGLNPNR